VKRRARISAIALAVLFVIPLSSMPSRAGDKEDSATIAAVDKIVRGDVVQANYGEAKKKLRALLDRCKRGCSPAEVAQVHVALGLVSAQIGQVDEAKTSWFDALNADASVQLPASGVSPAIRQQWEQTQKAWLAANPLPGNLRFYSLVTLPDRGRISRIVAPTYEKLAKIDPRNDSQVIYEDQIVPGSALLGFLNADHWAVVVPVARAHPVIGSTLANRNDYPREALLEAVLRFVEEDLANSNQ